MMYLLPSLLKEIREKCVGGRKFVRKGVTWLHKAMTQDSRNFFFFLAIDPFSFIFSVGFFLIMSSRKCG